MSVTRKAILALLAIALCIGFGVTTACAAPYVSGNVGAVFVNDADFTDFEGDKGEITFDTGFVMTGAIGNTFANGFRGEIELSYRANDLDKVKYDNPIFGSFSVDGDLSTIALMINGYYHFMPDAAFSPFIGAGVGVANVEGDIDGLDKDDDTVFAYQLALGGSIAASQNLSIDLQYHFFATEDPEFDLLEGEYNTQNLMVGLRYSF